MNSNENIQVVESVQLESTPLETMVPNEEKRGRGRPKLSDEQKKANKLLREQGNPPKKRGRKPLTEEQKAKKRNTPLTEEQREKRKVALRAFFNKPENKIVHQEKMKIYNEKNKEMLRARRSVYFNTYLNNRVRKEAEKMIQMNSMEQNGTKNKVE